MARSELRCGLFQAEEDRAALVVPRPRFLVEAYLALTECEGTVWVRNDASWVLGEEDTLSQEIQGCPVTQERALEIVAEVFELDSEAAARKHLQDYKRMLDELRAEVGEIVAGSLPELRLPHNRPKDRKPGRG